MPIAPFYRLMASQLRRPSGLLARLTGRKMNESNANMYRLMLDNFQLQAGQRVLEIGFGNGKFFADLAAKTAGLWLWGIDFSPEMVREAARNNPDLIQRGSLQVTQGSSDRLPYASGMFDAVYACNVIYFWQNPEAHLAEITRVLRPGGVFYTGFRPRESMQDMPFARYGFTHYSTGEWQGCLERHGFRVENVVQVQDPETKVGGINLRLQSVCMAARKLG
ncbi:MAG: methyltransferase domain-containing protein [Bacteroidetes bacterium]|nr:methyltransferase domain-containing protein [Bacteroidota bacterium]